MEPRELPSPRDQDVAECNARYHDRPRARVAGVGLGRPQVPDPPHRARVRSSRDRDVVRRPRPRSRHPTSVVAQERSLERDSRVHCLSITRSTSLWRHSETSRPFDASGPRGGPNADSQSQAVRVREALVDQGPYEAPPGLYVLEEQGACAKTRRKGTAGAGATSASSSEGVS